MKDAVIGLYLHMKNKQCTIMKVNPEIFVATTRLIEAVSGILIGSKT